MTHSRDAYAHPELLISPQELSAILASEGTHPLLLDVRAAEHFAAGHLPEAIHLDLWASASTTPTMLRWRRSCG